MRNHDPARARSARHLSVLLAAGALVALAGVAHAAPPVSSRDALLCRANSAVGYSYWWGHSCWCDAGCAPSGGCDAGGCAGSCPSCNHWGGHGADCSGYVNKVWQVPGPVSIPGTCDHGPYVAASFKGSTSNWTVIGRSQAKKMDAFASSSHVLLYDYGDPWGSIMAFEAKGCVYGVKHNIRTCSSAYSVARRANLADCAAHCEGTKIVDAGCGTGDCAAFGSYCVDDALGVRCVFGMCPATGGKAICIDDHTMGTCSNGQLQKGGNCGDFAAYCSTAGGAAPHCASVFCVGSPGEVASAKDVCLPDSQRYHCDGSGGLAPKPCPPGQICKSTPSPHCETGVAPCPPAGELDVCLDDGTIGHCKNGMLVSQGSCAAFGSSCVADALGARCVFYKCPAVGTATICVDDHLIGSCKNGALSTDGDCGAFAAWCSTAGGTAPHCASVFCAATPDEVPTQKDVCLPDGQRVHCDANGGISPVPCPAGQVCSASPSVHCEGGFVPGKCPPSGEDEICVDQGTIGHCSGGKVESKGDCAMFGAYCADDALGARCVFYLCPPVGAAEICLDEHVQASCKDGALTKGGDCGAYAAWCSTAGGAAPHCASAFCVESAAQIPIPHDVCLPDGKRYHCDEAGGLTPIAATETCDGTDDDCDGQTDEGFGVGASCTEGEGACAVAGTTACAADGKSTICNAKAGAAPLETCNGADDDCDGEVDEVFDLGAPCVGGTGACTAAGVTVCAEDGTHVVCDAAPGAPSDEVCNGLDDDCDGDEDEGFPIGEACTVGEGACAGTGQWACANGGEVQCVAEVADCSDGDPCTVDICDESAGCSHVSLPNCCQSTDECPAGQVCTDHECLGVQCRACAGDSDCPLVDARCVEYPGGAACAVPCPEGACPQGFECKAAPGTDAGVAVCVASGDSCECADITTACMGGAIVGVNGCGAVVDTLTVCGRGCVDGSGCCEKGTIAKDGACLPVDEPGAVGDDPAEVDAGPGAVATPERDVGANSAGGAFDSGIHSPRPAGSPSGDGCATGAGEARGASLLLLLLLLTGLRRRA